MLNEFEENFVSSEESVKRTVEKLNDRDIFAEQFGRSGLSKELNYGISKINDPVAKRIRFCPEIVGIVGNKSFIAEVKTRRQEHASSKRFTINRKDRLEYLETQNAWSGRMILICEDENFIGVNFLDTTSIYTNVPTKEYEYVYEKDLMKVAPFFWKTYLSQS